MTEKAGIFTRLAIDIGGTNIRLGLLPDDRMVMIPSHISSFSINDFAGLSDVITLYLQQIPPEVLTQTPEAVAIAVATPVTGDQVKLTNHDWQFSISAIHREFGFQRVKVVNDFTALALSIPWLQPDELITVGGEQIQTGGAIALLGAGTGLGVSGLVNTADGYYPLSGEGGHVSLGARNTRELALFGAFIEKYGHMSAERLLSGTGLTEFYQVIRRQDGLPADKLRPEEISARAMSGRCASCIEVMNLFCEMLGIVASDLVMTLGASDGVYIGGGIVPKLGEYFTNSAFRRQFETKGRFSQFLQQVPVYVIQAEQPALRGAAYALEPRFSKLGMLCS